MQMSYSDCNYSKSKLITVTSGKWSEVVLHNCVIELCQIIKILFFNFKITGTFRYFQLNASFITSKKKIHERGRCMIKSSSSPLATISWVS